MSPALQVWAPSVADSEVASCSHKTSRAPERSQSRSVKSRGHIYRITATTIESIATNRQHVFCSESVSHYATRWLITRSRPPSEATESIPKSLYRIGFWRLTSYAVDKVPKVTNNSEIEHPKRFVTSTLCDIEGSNVVPLRGSQCVFDIGVDLCWSKMLLAT